MPDNEVTPSPSPAEIAITRATWQSALFAHNPRRVELLRLRPQWPTKSIDIRVHRNQPFELVTQAMPPFLAYGGMSIGKVKYGDYDDSLVWHLDGLADVDIVSLDFERYRSSFSPDKLVAWLGERLEELASQIFTPILVSNWPAVDSFADDVNSGIAEIGESLPSIGVCDVRTLCRDLGDEWRDERTASVKAIDWSDSAVVSTARAYATKWLPAVVRPAIKAVAVDLDNTLYEGILGEDGVNGVRLTPEHAELQHELVALSKAGVFVAVISRNEAQDVRTLFDSRSDFPLRPEHVTAWAVSWADKAGAVRDAAAQLRISEDAVAFLDDNAGEIAAVAAEVPDVFTLHAASAEASIAALRHCPGLFRFRSTYEDTVRTKDLATASVRDRMIASAGDPEEYIRSLEIELRYWLDQSSDITRMAELSSKTNQFNTSLKRRSAGEIVQQLEDGTTHAVTFSLQDRLSDSGKVGVVFAHVAGSRLVVEEICISCRALGRKLETTMIDQALVLLAGDQEITEVDFAFTTGPRNQPALDWLVEYCGKELVAEGMISTAWNNDDARRRIDAAPCSVIVEAVGD